VDHLPRSPRLDYRRRVRTLAGTFQLLRWAPWLVWPGRNRAFLPFLSHKVLRLGSPLFLLAVLVASLSRPGRLEAALLGAQVVAYGLAATGWFAENAEGVVATVARGALAFVMVNVAVVAAAIALLRGRASLLWRPLDGSRGRPLELAIGGSRGAT
jgi:hypothetical protein